MKHGLLAKRYWKIRMTPMNQVDRLAEQFDDVINLSLGDPDLVTDRRIIQEAMLDAERGYTKYGDFQGDPELRKEIAAFYDQEYHLMVSDDEIFVTAGACVAMYLVLEAILDDGDEVILQAPYFTPYPEQVRLARGIPVELPTYEEENFQIDLERLESLINERTRALVINSPNNPTGACLTRATLNGIGKLAEKYDLIVISDEIYTAYGFQKPFISILEVEGMKKRAVVINSFSKNFNMTGWRVGNIIAPPPLVRVIQEIDGNVTFTASSVSQRAALHALRIRKEIQPAIVEEYRSRVNDAVDQINQIDGMSARPVEGTFYIFINIKETGGTSEEISRRILEEAHVLTLPGNAFGSCGEGYLRVACTVRKEVLKEAFQRIRRMKLIHNNSQNQ